MAASSHRDLLVSSSSDDAQVLVSATRDRAGAALAVHCVNASESPRPLALSFADGSKWKAVRVTALTGDGPLADNTPEDMDHVAPRDITAEFARQQTLPAYSYTVIEASRQL